MGAHERPYKITDRNTLETYLKTYRRGVMSNCKLVMLYRGTDTVYAVKRVEEARMLIRRYLELIATVERELRHRELERVFS